MDRDQWAGDKRTRRFFKKVFFFQKPYRIILAPPKHVLHLVWSVLGISTAFKMALYNFFDGPLTPSNGQFIEKGNHYNRKKQINI